MNSIHWGKSSLTYGPFARYWFYIITRLKKINFQNSEFLPKLFDNVQDFCKVISGQTNLKKNNRIIENKQCRYSVHITEKANKTTLIVEYLLLQSLWFFVFGLSKWQNCFQSVFCMLSMSNFINSNYHFSFLLFTFL